MFLVDGHSFDVPIDRMIDSSPNLGLQLRKAIDLCKELDILDLAFIIYLLNIKRTYIVLSIIRIPGIC